MQNVPKIVVNRLQSPAADSHPDADVLTAFAEPSLGGLERDHVVDHLARCADCREVVSLALPPQVEVLPTAHGSGNRFRRPLLRGSALRWVAIAAGVVLIASIGTLQYRRQQRGELASYVPPAQRAIATPAPSPEPASQVAVPQTRMQKDKLATPSAQTALAENKPASSEGANFHPRANSAVAIHGDVGGVGIGSGAGRSFNGGSFHGSAVAVAPQNLVPAGSAAKQNPAPAPAQQNAVVAGAQPTVEVQTETAQVATQSTAQGQIQDQLIQSKSAEQSQAYANRVDKAKPASPQGSLAMAPAPLLHTVPSLIKGWLAAPRWTISASGSLQRSFDGAKTWLDVNPAADGSSLDRRQKTQMATVEVQAESTSEAQLEAQPEAKKQAKFKNNEKQPAPTAATIFRALSVSSNAAEVWAGGSGGALYHSVDAGNSWARVLPSTAGLNLTGDILSIQFSDPRNGTVTTSTPEVWTTADDGQTWQKQP